MSGNSSSNNSNTNKHPTYPAKGNPYEALSLPNLATPSQIKKKFRELSLKLHPDKRRARNRNRNQQLTESQINDNDLDLDNQFIAVQEARAFLLNEEYRKEKETYDAKLQSEALRKVEDQRREEQMTGRRRAMKTDLERKIGKALARASAGTSTSTNSNKDVDINIDSHSRWKRDKFEDLKRDGTRMRESYADRQAAAENAEAVRQQKKRKRTLEARQVRVKWSRKKMAMSSSHSEHSLAKVLEAFKFGMEEHARGSSSATTVEQVELIGSKGNAALITFVTEASCQPCVDHYRHSDIMRATHVDKRKEESDNRNRNASERARAQSRRRNDDDDEDAMLGRETDRESVEERKLRQAAEREALLRKMERGGDSSDDGDDNDDGGDDNDDGAAKSKATRKDASEKERKDKKINKTTAKFKSLFPPHLPSTGTRSSMNTGTSNTNPNTNTPLERLEEMEMAILRDILPKETIQAMKLSAA